MFGNFPGGSARNNVKSKYLPHYCSIKSPLSTGVWGSGMQFTRALVQFHCLRCIQTTLYQTTSYGNHISSIICCPVDSTPHIIKRMYCLFEDIQTITILCQQNRRDLGTVKEHNIYLRMIWEKWFPNKLRPRVMPQSIPAVPSPLPSPHQADPRALAFFCLGWQIPRGGDSWVVKSPGVGTKKEGKCPVLHQHCNIFYWLHSRMVLF